VTLTQVRRWARAHGISRATFARAHDDAFLIAVSRLLQAIYREDYTPSAVLRRDTAGRWSLDLGREPMLRAPVNGPLPFRRLEVTGFPRTIAAGKRTTVRAPRAFLNALERCLKAREITRHFERLVADFNNSFANLVLNRLLGQRLHADAQAIEPVYHGHHYAPFPALRVGPSIAHVVECSNLCRKPIDLPLVAVHPGRFDSADFDDHEACLRAWAGLSLPRSTHVVIPLHPWQLKLSPVVRELLQRRWITVLPDRLQAVPLASQRTCRIVATGFDVKLPINATVTSEVRLLYPLNRANAPAVSVLARILLEASGERTLDFQHDVASMAHAEPRIGTHLSAIVRSPVPQRPGEVVVPALTLWSRPRRTRTLPDLRRPREAHEFFRAYCRVLMRGPVDFYARWGMAFEPHLQNVYVALHDGMPARVILRDLDATILDPGRIRPLVRANRLRLAPATWQHMPSFESGGLRLTHAMLYGHLGEVMSYLTGVARADLATLAASVEDTWSELIAAAPSPSCRRVVRDLRAQSNTVRAMLRRRLSQPTPVSRSSAHAGARAGTDRGRPWWRPAGSIRTR
jgi:siderophore synthetase component